MCKNSAISKIDEIFMDLALEESEKALELDEIPVGCVVIKKLDLEYLKLILGEEENGNSISNYNSKIENIKRNFAKKVIAKSHNFTNAFSDPLAHAELLCLRSLIKGSNETSVEENNNIKDLVFYITLEPCAMCVGILERINATVIFGYRNEIFGANKILNKNYGKCINDMRCIEILKRFYETPNKNTIKSKY